jgi:hypothetical protein
VGASRQQFVGNEGKYVDDNDGERKGPTIMTMTMLRSIPRDVDDARV